MQTRNNYEKPARRWPSGGEVFNGDVGRIRAIDMENQMVTVSFDGREVDCDFVDSDELALAYAVSVHKPQGSEYPAVLIPVLSQHYVLLQRNLIYTAVTRAKRLFVMVGTSKALAIAVRNDKTEKQYTYLRYRVSG